MPCRLHTLACLLTGEWCGGGAAAGGARCGGMLRASGAPDARRPLAAPGISEVEVASAVAWIEEPQGEHAAGVGGGNTAEVHAGVRRGVTRGVVRLRIVGVWAGRRERLLGSSWAVMSLLFQLKISICILLKPLAPFELLPLEQLTGDTWSGVRHNRCDRQ